MQSSKITTIFMFITVGHRFLQKVSDTRNLVLKINLSYLLAAWQPEWRSLIKNKTVYHQEKTCLN